MRLAKTNVAFLCDFDMAEMRVCVKLTEDCGSEKMGVEIGSFHGRSINFVRREEL